MSTTTAPEAPPTPRPPRPKRSPRAGLVGPLFKWELVRLARRGQDARARFILAVALLFVLTVFTFAWFPRSDPYELFFGTSQTLSLQDSARFAEQFTLTFLLAQLAVLVLLTPAYAAGGIAEEKEKKTFVFLLVSDLTSREILFGKFLGRLAFLLGVMVAGLPILAITQLYGGVSLKFLLMGYLITAATVVMHAAVSAAAACATDTFRGALFRGYGLAALHVLVGCGLHPMLSPFAIIAFLYGMEATSPEMFLVTGLGYAAVELTVAVVAVILAVRWVRRMRARVLGPDGRLPRDPRRKRDDLVYRPRKRTEEPAPIILDEQPAGMVVLGAEHEASANGEPVPSAAPLPAAKVVRQAAALPKPEPPRAPPRRRPPPPPDYLADRPRVYADDPFMWKERFTTGAKRDADDESIRGVLIAVGVSVAVVVGFFLLISVMAVLLSGFSETGMGAAGRLLMTAGAGGLFTYLLVVGAGSSGSVVKERQRQTLESLLSLPVDRRAILWPKWVVSLSRGWWWGAPGVIAVPVAFLVSPAPAAALPAGLYVAAAVPLTVSLGLWLSIRCRTVTRAVLWLLPAIGGLTLYPAVVWMASDVLAQPTTTALMSAAALGTAAAAWGLWRLAVREFEREGR